jgi:mannose-6-phosphate isomerase-like protein (cupin superfamily)
MTDHGPQPFVTDIEAATLANDTFRTTLWTGRHLQLTAMCLQPEEQIGLEVHDDVDQFLRVEGGTGLVEMGPARDDLSFRREISDDDAVLVPAGSWHNVTNTGGRPLRLYSVYGPAEHPHGTVHVTKEDADAAEHDH